MTAPSERHLLVCWLWHSCVKQCGDIFAKLQVRIDAKDVIQREPELDTERRMTEVGILVHNSDTKTIHLRKNKTWRARRAVGRQ